MSEEGESIKKLYDSGNKLFTLDDLKFLEHQMSGLNTKVGSHDVTAKDVWGNIRKFEAEVLK